MRTLTISGVTNRFNDIRRGIHNEPECCFLRDVRSLMNAANERVSSEAKRLFDQFASFVEDRYTRQVLARRGL